MNARARAVRHLIPTPGELTSLLWFGAAALYILVLILSMTRISYDIWGGLLLGTVLSALTLPLLRRSVRNDDPTMVNLVTAAFLVKLLGAVARYVGTYGVYGYGDATGYHNGGSRLAQGFWDGHFADVYEEEVPYLVGTPFIRLTTGLLYIVTGPTRLGGFVVYSLLSFFGLYLFYRALRTAFPEANHRRYAYLLFFLPSLLYWPSSIGKEAWMLCTLGLATYGIALILKHQPVGYPYAGFGMAGMAMIRPHVTALCVVALMFAYIIRRRSWRESALGPVGKVAGISVLLVGGGIVLGQAASFFDVDGGASGVDQVFEQTEGQTSTGGSEFETARPNSPAQYPKALLSVLFRPFPWEADNAQMTVAALEGILLLLVFVASWRRLARVPGLVFRVPYVAYCVAFTAMFVFAFSSISNFGILTRQRTQVFPMVLVLLAIPETRRARHDELSDEGDILIEDELRRVRVGSPTTSHR